LTMKARELWYILKCALEGWWNDNVPRLGASLAYYTLFAMAPILIISIAIAGFFFGPEAVPGEVVAQIRGVVGATGAQAVQAMLENASTRGDGTVATVVGLVTFFIGSTGA